MKYLKSILESNVRKVILESDQDLANELKGLVDQYKNAATDDEKKPILIKIIDVVSVMFKSEAEELVKSIESDPIKTTKGNYGRYMSAISQMGLTGLYLKGFIKAMRNAGAGQGLTDALKISGISESQVSDDEILESEYDETSDEKKAWGSKAKSFMRKIAKGLQAKGFEVEHLKWNKGGPAIMGDVNLLAWKPESEYGLHVWYSGFDDKIIYRTTTKKNKWTGHSNNQINPRDILDIGRFVNKLVSMVDDAESKGF